MPNYYNSGKFSHRIAAEHASTYLEELKDLKKQNPAPDTLSARISYTIEAVTQLMVVLCEEVDRIADLGENNA